MSNYKLTESAGKLPFSGFMKSEDKEKNHYERKKTSNSIMLDTNTTAMASEKFSELIQGEKPVLVDFSAEWCGPCKMMAPILSELKHQVGELATIIKVDVDRNQQAAAAYGVQSVPTLILFRKGQIVWRQSGVVPAESLKQIILQHQ
jgi:thioredoxin 1